MKSFKEYLTEKEEIECQQELNENFFTSAGSVLGYSASGLLLAWGSSLIIKGYMSFGQKAITGITKFWGKMFKGGTTKPNTTVDIIKDMKQENTVKVQIEKGKSERDKYVEKLEKVFAAIEAKDVDKAIEELKLSGLKQNPEINRVLVNEVVKVFGEPPIHYGNTGNDCYLFVKRFLGIKVAQTTAALVKEALRKHGSDLVKDEEGNLNNKDE